MYCDVVLLFLTVTVAGAVGTLTAGIPWNTREVGVKLIGGGAFPSPMTTLVAPVVPAASCTVKENVYERGDPVLSAGIVTFFEKTSDVHVDLDGRPVSPGDTERSQIE